MFGSNVVVDSLQGTIFVGSARAFLKDSLDSSGVPGVVSDELLFEMVRWCNAWLPCCTTDCVFAGSRCGLVGGSEAGMVYLCP